MSIIIEDIDIAVRAYVRMPEEDAADKAHNQKKPRLRKNRPIPSDWVLVFDTETTTDSSQRLRFGTYQVRNGDLLHEAGVFYDPAGLNASEQLILQAYAEAHGLEYHPIKSFIEEVFYEVGYFWRATIVGFNLPFDISRLAVHHTPARASPWDRIMQGGFSFHLSTDKNKARVQIKHRSSRDSFIRFAAVDGQRTTRGNRKKGRLEPIHRGFFIDIKTLAAALTSKSHSLDSLAKALNVSAKLYTKRHGRPLTNAYINYAIQDTQTTWECYGKLRAMYELHGLTDTPMHKIHSEAGLGKAYLRQMGITPWQKMQPNFPPDLLGIIMSTYFGGRSEIHIRREIRQVLYCDFLSMYPTVCTLMGLWRFAIAQETAPQDSTAETRALLKCITLDDLQKQHTWRLLCTLVKVVPDGEIFPVRAKYSEEAQYTIGTNYLYAEDGTAIWVTLADCISAKLLSGKIPNIIKALSFVPGEKQRGLKPVNIAGNSDYAVNPGNGDFFKRLIDLRSKIKAEMKQAERQKKADLDSRQLALKILANATSYGIFVEFNVEDKDQLQPLNCYGPGGEAFPVSKKKFEAPGTFFHPLLATCITGAARLMLAVTERLIADSGLDWAFCDTDSMAIAKPDDMAEEEFIIKAMQVRAWFEPLNPYAKKESLLKIEDNNYKLTDTGAVTPVLQPLFCFAVSSKRYALFNLDGPDNPILRKVSAHGLGHLLAPYERKDTAKLEDVGAWQQGVWLEIIKASLRNDSDHPDFASLKHFNRPAVSRYAATTPKLERWFKTHNQERNYHDRVRPFNFLLSMQSTNSIEDGRPIALKPVAPYQRNPAKAAAQCFCRETGQPVAQKQLKTYLEALAQYHLHPETKFLNGDYLDIGTTQRRHIRIRAIRHIGKEANEWEEQFYLGFNPEEQIEYGASPAHQEQTLKLIKTAVRMYGLRKLARTAGISYQQLSVICSGKAIPRCRTSTKLSSVMRKLMNRP